MRLWLTSHKASLVQLIWETRLRMGGLRRAFFFSFCKVGCYSIRDAIDKCHHKWHRLFSHESKSEQFERSFELHNLNYHSNDGILDRVYAKLHCDAWFELRISNDGLDHDLNCAIQIMHRGVTLRTHGPKYRHSNDNSNCALLLSCENSHSFVIWKPSTSRSRELSKFTADAGHAWQHYTQSGVLDLPHIRAKVPGLCN